MRPLKVYSVELFYDILREIYYEVIYSNQHSLSSLCSICFLVSFQDFFTTMYYLLLSTDMRGSWRSSRYLLRYRLLRRFELVNVSPVVFFLYLIQGDHKYECLLLEYIHSLLLGFMFLVPKSCPIS